MPKKSISKGKRSRASSKPASQKIELVIERVSEIMARHGLAELEWDDGRERLRLCKFGSPHAQAFHHIPAPAIPAPVSIPAPAAPDAPQAASAKAAPAPESNQRKILAPFVGTFYRAPSPGSAPYIKEGQVVKKGDVLCIIEAMKLMNELESEHTGKILSVLVENGQPVEFGEPLFLVET